jgi:hypothetical protein
MILQELSGVTFIEKGGAKSRFSQKIMRKTVKWKRMELMMQMTVHDIAIY